MIQNGSCLYGTSVAEIVMLWPEAHDGNSMQIRLSLSLTGNSMATVFQNNLPQKNKKKKRKRKKRKEKSKKKGMKQNEFLPRMLSGRAL